MAFLETLPSTAGKYSGKGLIAAFTLIKRNFAKLQQDYVNDGAADRVLAATDQGKTIIRSRGTAQTVTLPQDSAVEWPIGGHCTIIAQGAGALTMQAGSGATMEKRASTSAVVIAKGSVRVTKVAANTFNVSGDLTAA